MPKNDMPKKLSAFLSGGKMTAVSGVFLALSLVLLIVKKTAELNVNAYLNPAWGTILISGYPLLYLAFSRLFGERRISSALLISVAMIASLCIGEVFAAGEVAFIMALGALLEDKTAERAKKGLKKLVGLVPQTGRVIGEDGEEKIIPAGEIEAGMRLRVLAGERIPADGKIVAGTTSVDESVLTGESLPAEKAQGDEVFCGTINCFGWVDIEATGVRENSALQKMIRLMKEAEEKKAPMQRTADRWATWLVPVALLLSVVAGVAAGVWLGDASVALERAVTVLVVFCPCALVLATPTAVMAGIGQATGYGVLIKSGEAMERMGKSDCIAFDKTGTLTSGKLTVSDVLSFGRLSKEELLALAASVESRSEHPLGRAVTAFAKSQKAALRETEDFVMAAGKGVSGRVDGRRYFCGTRRYLEENGIVFTQRQTGAFDALRDEGKAVIFVSDESEALGAIGLSDTLRPEAPETVRKLKTLGCKVVLLTGDHKSTAEYFARKAGIGEVRAELLPQDKADAVAKLRREGHCVCMVGDGVNDAAALKTADVGVAMGGEGSDIAADAAGVALVGDDLAKLPYLALLSRATLKTIRLGISLSMAINFTAIALSFFGLLTPITGAIVHNAGSVLVVLIAALLYDRKLIRRAEAL